MATKSQLQLDYEALDFPPGCDAPTILKALAKKHNITYEELLDQINL